MPLSSLVFQVELQSDLATAQAMHHENIDKSQHHLKLFRAYEEHVDKLISQALLGGIESRYDICLDIFIYFD